MSGAVVELAGGLSAILIRQPFRFPLGRFRFFDFDMRSIEGGGICGDGGIPGGGGGGICRGIGDPLFGRFAFKQAIAEHGLERGGGKLLGGFRGGICRVDKRKMLVENNFFFFGEVSVHRERWVWVWRLDRRESVDEFGPGHNRLNFFAAIIFRGIVVTGNGMNIQSIFVVDKRFLTGAIFRHFRVELVLHIDEVIKIGLGDGLDDATEIDFADVIKLKHFAFVGDILVEERDAGLGVRLTMEARRNAVRIPEFDIRGEGGDLFVGHRERWVGKDKMDGPGPIVNTRLQSFFTRPNPAGSAIRPEDPTRRTGGD